MAQYDLGRLEGQRVRLRDWQVADLPVWADWQKPGQRWKELDGPYYPGLTQAETHQIAAQRRGQIERNAWPTPRSNLVIADRADDAFLGLVTWDWESEETFWPTVGIVIFDPAHWGGGRGYEAFGLWSDYLFETLPQIRRLDLRTWSGNAGMVGLARKLGYQEEARFRQARIVKGEVYDGLGYGVLRQEWAERYPNGFAAHLKNGS